MSSPTQSSADERFWAVLEWSVIGVAAARAAKALAAAHEHSRAIQWLGTWRVMMSAGVRRFVGLTAITASVVHVVLMWPRDVIGFWWLIVPAMALAFGVVAVLMSLGTDRR